MNFPVTQSSLPVLVGPSEPTPAGHLPLTSADKGCLYLPVMSLHIFDRPIHEPAETIRRALSGALVHYYPLAGRLDASGLDVELACTGDGVEYVAATASCTLEDIRFLDSPLVTPLDAFVVRAGDRVRMSDCPLLMMQVTEFACGGYVVGVTWNHAVADAFGMAQFLGAVGELARGLSVPSVLPVRNDAALPEIPHLFGAVGPYLDFTHAEYAYTDVTIPWSFINRVKAEYAGVDQPCSTFDVVAAAVWQCRTRAMNADPASPALLVFTANVRKLIGAKDGYYGNCIALQMVVSTCGAVANGGAAETVKLIKHAKERIPYILGNYEPVVFSEEVVGALCGYAPLFVSSWGGIGLDGVDFGGGRPARVMVNTDVTCVPCCIPCLPSSRKDGDGVNVLAFCVREEHVDRFHAELATLH